MTGHATKQLQPHILGKPSRGKIKPAQESPAASTCRRKDAMKKSHDWEGCVQEGAVE